MNILRRDIYTHTREKLEWPIIAVTVDPFAARLVLERDSMPKKTGGEGEKEFEIPENVTEVEDVRAINGERERKKGRKKESVKMRDIED